MTSNVAPEGTLGSIVQGVARVLEGLVAIAPVVGTARVARVWHRPPATS